MDQKENKNGLKNFLIKLVAISFAIILIINITYNLILADNLKNLNILSSLNKKENIEMIKDKIRTEINNGLKKDQILHNEDKELLLKLYKKLKKEFEDFETN